MKAGGERHPTARLRSRAGFSLTEALISLGAGLAVLGAAFQALTHFQARLATQHQAMARIQDLRLGLSLLEAEVRLAGTGSPLSATPLLRAQPQEVEFQANLGGLVTALTEAAAAGQQEVAVAGGAGWPKGKRVVICVADRCAEHRLARDGRTHALSLTSPLAQAFPVGSAVSVFNQVRYYLREDPGGRGTLMRMVDGGANPLIGDLGRFRLSYLDRAGQPTQDPVRVARVRIEVGAADSVWVITRDVGVRGT